MVLITDTVDKKDNCVPQDLKYGEVPDYQCILGEKHYLSRDEKKDYEYGGKCPKICDIRGDDNRGGCPNVDFVSDTVVARNTCEADTNCMFIGNQTLDRNGPNYCVPKKREGCITLTESDLVKSDKELTDSPDVCNRMGVGCIFHRGADDPKIGRNGNPTCLRGCLGSKYWNNPDYIWGKGGTTQDPFKGSFFNSDLRMGPRYIEASPSRQRPTGWGGPKGSPWFGNGLLPKSLGIPYTESRGKYSPPCNLSEGDVAAFTTQATGENLAGPGCMLTAPRPEYGLRDWTYTCRCKFANEIKVDAHAPCKEWELNQENINKRDVCEGCHISNDKNSKLYGHCVLGEDTPDTESRLLGCFDDPNNPGKCRVERIVENTECPAYCSQDPDNPTPLNWDNSTQCSKQLNNGCWKLNPDRNKIISLEQVEADRNIPSPYLPGDSIKDTKCEIKDTDYLCQNCAQTSIKTIGSGTLYPNRSSCVVGGSETIDALTDAAYSSDLGRKLSCPATCSGCHTGFFGQPMKPHYKLSEATDPSSVFHKGIIFTPWIGKQAANLNALR